MTPSSDLQVEEKTASDKNRQEFSWTRLQLLTSY